MVRSQIVSYDRYRTDKPGITDPLHPARFAVPFGFNRVRVKKWVQP